MSLSPQDASTKAWNLHLEVVDLLIVITFVSFTVLSGLFGRQILQAVRKKYFPTPTPVGSEKQEDITQFFLGGRELPWWALACSGMSANLDVSGTMINTAMIYAIGVKGAWIELRGGLTLPLAFMIVIGKWLRRSNAMTASEWMNTRFGNGREGKAARLATALVSLVFSIGTITFFAIGSGKFVAQFMQIPDFWGVDQRVWTTIALAILSMLYTVTIGFEGVVWTDIAQALAIVVIVAVMVLKSFVEIPAMPSHFTLSSPLKDGHYFKYSMDWNDWTSILPKWDLDFPEDSTYSVYNLFTIVVSMYFLRMVIEGMGGPLGYVSQRFLAAKNEHEASTMSMGWITMLSLRWPFIIAVCMLGIFYTQTGRLHIKDPEMVLPAVISTLPLGVKGLLLGVMTSAAMSTFDSTVNAASAVYVKDIYLPYFSTAGETEKTLMVHSRLSSIFIALFGVSLTFFIGSVNEIWAWVTMSLVSGLIVPLCLRWYWWRFNGYGYAAGCIAGMIASCVVELLPRLLAGRDNIMTFFPEYTSFVFVAGSSFIASVLVSIMTEATDEETLKTFYKTVRPFGIWKPIREQVVANKEEEASIRRENIIDMISIPLAVSYQLLLYFLGMTFVLRTWNSFIIILGLTVAVTAALYVVWYKNLYTFSFFDILNNLASINLSMNSTPAAAQQNINATSKEAPSASSDTPPSTTTAPRTEVISIEEDNEPIRPQQRAVLTSHA